MVQFQLNVRINKSHSGSKDIDFKGANIDKLRKLFTVIKCTEELRDIMPEFKPKKTEIIWNCVF